MPKMKIVAPHCWNLNAQHTHFLAFLRRAICGCEFVHQLFTGRYAAKDGCIQCCDTSEAKQGWSPKTVTWAPKLLELPAFFCWQKVAVTKLGIKKSMESIRQVHVQWMFPYLMLMYSRSVIISQCLHHHFICSQISSHATNDLPTLALILWTGLRFCPKKGWFIHFKRSWCFPIWPCEKSMAEISLSTFFAIQCTLPKTNMDTQKEQDGKGNSL